MRIALRACGKVPFALASGKFFFAVSKKKANFARFFRSMTFKNLIIN